MLSVIREAFVPLLSLFIFVLGTGFFATLLSLNMSIRNESPMLIGIMTSLFYAGLVLGSFRVEKLIIRIGHIRAYAGFSASLAVICLLHGLYYQPYWWLALRFIAGLSTAGLFVVIESWLLCKSNPVNRGQILSLYMVTFYGAQSLGQFILNIGSIEQLTIFSIASMLCSLSIIPLAMSHVQTPQIETPSTLGWSALIRQTTSGLLGCLSAGMIMSAIQGLMPTVFRVFFKDTSLVAWYMFIIIFGGMLLQYPLGRISDIVERRLVLIMLNVLTIFLSVLSILYFEDSTVFCILMLWFGGLTFTLYPISISHACDSLTQKDIIAGIQSLLLAYSVGAILGPLIAPLFMHYFGANGLFIFYICVCGAVVPLIILRKAQKADIPQEETFVSMSQTTPVMFELDPRSEEQ